MITLYLSGPLLDCSMNEIFKWRNDVKIALKYEEIKILDPTARTCDMSDENSINRVVELDKQDVLSSDILLVNYLKPSVGTSMEILQAWNSNIPVVTIIEDHINVSPWLIYHSNCIVHNLIDAIEIIRRFALTKTFK